MKSLIADSLDAHAFAPYFKTGVELMDTIDEDTKREHEKQNLPVVEYCTSIKFMNQTFNTDAYTDELPPCLQDPWFQFQVNLEPPAKQQCLRPRGGARTRAPPRTPGDNTLPIRPTTQTPTTAPAVPRRLNLTLDEAMSESDIDHVVETAEDLYSLEVMLAIMEEEAAEFSES